MRHSLSGSPRRIHHKLLRPQGGAVADRPHIPVIACVQETNLTVTATAGLMPIRNGRAAFNRSCANLDGCGTVEFSDAIGFVMNAVGNGNRHASAIVA